MRRIERDRPAHRCSGVANVRGTHVPCDSEAGHGFACGSTEHRMIWSSPEPEHRAVSAPFRRQVGWVLVLVAQCVLIVATMAVLMRA